MSYEKALIDISKVLLSESAERSPEILLRHVLAALGARRGFIVVREGGALGERCSVGFDSEDGASPERRFSRSLVQEAVETGEVIFSPDIGTDPRWESSDSAQWLGGTSVLVAPLRHGEAIYGVVYVDQMPFAMSLSAEVSAFVLDFAELAGLFIARALEAEALRRRAARLEQGIFAQHDLRGIITHDPGMLRLLGTAIQVASSEATVVIQGETGTGKELIARAIHANSPRRARPFVTVHCAALPASVLEAELFGHTRGAFTGAGRERAGRLASAHQGTLFLDEIGEISPELQTKLLRFLQFGEIQRVGSDTHEAIDVRLVVATHRDLQAEVDAGRFREDLYYRIKVVDLVVPPLRERESDVPVLLAHFLERFWRRSDGPARFTPEAMARLLAHDWPGNVRELAHTVERACVLAVDPELGADLLPPKLAGMRRVTAAAFTTLTNDALKSARQEAIEGVEDRFIDALMGAHGGNVSQAAREGGFRRSQLQKLLARRGWRR